MQKHLLSQTLKLSNVLVPCRSCSRAPVLSLTNLKHPTFNSLSLQHHAVTTPSTLSHNVDTRPYFSSKHIHQSHASCRVHPLTTSPRASPPHPRHRLRFRARLTATWSATCTHPEDRATVRHDPTLPKVNWYVARRASWHTLLHKQHERAAMCSINCRHHERAVLTYWERAHSRGT